MSDEEKPIFNLDDPEDMALLEQVTEELANRKPRFRATKHQMKQRYHDIYLIAEAVQPATVRQIFYQCEVAGIVEKEESGVRKVGDALLEMRRSGRIPYAWIVDNTRWMRRPRTHSNLSEARHEAAINYRRSLWIDANVYVEVWLEKDALAGVVYPITEMFDVPLMVARGYASETYLYNAAQEISNANMPACIYHLGDYDPSGVNAGETIERRLREMAPDAEIHFERLAVLPWQIRTWD